MLALLAFALTASNIQKDVRVLFIGNSYTFVNNSTTANSGLKLNGGISGGDAGATTITLDGTNSVNATTSNSQVLGPIENGDTVSITIEGIGTLTNPVVRKGKS